MQRRNLLMNADLPQDLVLYKKSHEKAVSIAARSLVTLLREICSSILEDDACKYDSHEEGSDDGELANVCDIEELNEEIEVQAICIDGQDEDVDDGKDPSNRKKRKLGNFVECLNAVDATLRSLKRLVVIKATEVSTDEAYGIVSNEDFQHIKELKANKEAKKALSQHGLLRKNEGYKAANSKFHLLEKLWANALNPVKLEIGTTMCRSKIKVMPLATKKSKNSLFLTREKVEKARWRPSSFKPQSSPYSEIELGKKQTPLAQFLKFEKEDHWPVGKQEHERSHGIKTYGSSKQDISYRDVTNVKAMLWENEQEESEKDTGGTDHPKDDADT
ncbi:hypothetical protein HPP92_027685 [Vanilla planifolia]|uniref:Protein SDA1 n=1 Tax=Vanilla planifolia TaxID=51239 RepID=A0A835U408_VANPL|nr:hypothetical protein HPP92_027685 [Vanilla planifolia]